METCLAARCDRRSSFGFGKVGEYMLCPRKNILDRILRILNLYISYDEYESFKTGKFVAINFMLRP